jgi:uncharacterized membrane protein
MISLGAGAALALTGLCTRGVRDLAMIAMGGGLIHRGVTGHCHLYEALEKRANNQEAIADAT